MFQSGVVSVRTALSVNLARERSRATSAGRPESLSTPPPPKSGREWLLEAVVSIQVPGPTGTFLSRTILTKSLIRAMADGMVS